MGRVLYFFFGEKKSYVGHIYTVKEDFTKRFRVRLMIPLNLFPKNVELLFFQFNPFCIDELVMDLTKIEL